MTTSNAKMKPHHQSSLCYQSKIPEFFPVWITIFVLLVCLSNPSMPEVIYRVDPLALLAATLRTYQRAGCDSEQLSLSCPRGTSISIELAQYGRAGDLTDHSLCPPVSNEDVTTTGSTHDGVIHSGTEIEIKPPESCTVSGLQYALLQTVVDACQKKRHCKFAANSKTHSSGDPCSGIRKFVEIAYKCRPYEFRSKMACENDSMPLVCNPYSRIAIYSVTFGHSPQESSQCASINLANIKFPENPSKKNCLVSYATETVMQLCHGRRRCSITADAGTFGKPCKNELPMFLKVVYTCIPRKVLKDRYETAPEQDEPQQTDLELDQDELYDEDQFYRESEAIPPAPKLQSAIPKAGLPFNYNSINEPQTTTDSPPTYSFNDSSFEEALQSSLWMFNRIKTSLSKNTENNNSNVAVVTSNEASTNVNISTEFMNRELDGDHVVSGKKFFLQRKCQTEDDWGKIGLNCTEDDIIKERVEVIGFLINWIDSYIHIKNNQEEFYFYLIISMIVGVLICLLIVIGRLTLQRRQSIRKNSDTSINAMEKTFTDTGVMSVNTRKSTLSKKKESERAADTFVDDISEIDGDMNLTSPMSVPNLHKPNESFVTYVPTSNCNYGKLPSHSSVENTLMNSSHQNCLPLTGNPGCFNGKTFINSGRSLESHQLGFSQPQTIYTSMEVGNPSVSDALTIGGHIIGPSGLTSSVQHTNPVQTYITGTIMVPAQQNSYGGTLRKHLIPTSSGVASHAGNISQIPVSNYSSSSGIYYDNTVPRNLSRAISADNDPYYYG